MSVIDLTALKKITERLKSTLDKFPVKNGQKSSANLASPQFDTTYYQLTSQTESFRQVVTSSNGINLHDKIEKTPPPKKIESKFIQIRYNSFVNSEIPIIETTNQPFCGSIQPPMGSKPPLGHFIIAMIDNKPQFGMIGLNPSSNKIQFYNVSIMKGFATITSQDICYFPILYPKIFTPECEYHCGDEVYVLDNLEFQQDIKILFGKVIKSPSENGNTQYTIQLSNGDTINSEARFVTSIYSPHCENQNTKLYENLQKNSYLGVFKNKFDEDDLLFEVPNSPPPQRSREVKWGLQEYYPFPQARSGRLSKKAAENVRIARALIKAGESENTRYQFVLDDANEEADDDGYDEEAEPIRTREKAHIEFRKQKPQKKSKVVTRKSRFFDEEPDNADDLNYTERKHDKSSKSKKTVTKSSKYDPVEQATTSAEPERKGKIKSEIIKPISLGKANNIVKSEPIEIEAAEDTQNVNQQILSNDDHENAKSLESTQENTIADQQIAQNVEQSEKVTETPQTLASLKQLSLSSLLNDAPPSEQAPVEPAPQISVGSENTQTNEQTNATTATNDKVEPAANVSERVSLLLNNETSIQSSQPTHPEIIHLKHPGETKPATETEQNVLKSPTTTAKTLFIPKKQATPSQDKEESSPKKLRITIRVPTNTNNTNNNPSAN